MNYLYTTYILETVQKSINSIMDKKYKNLHQKLNKLEREQTNNFQPQVVNHTNICFSPEELILLNKGLKYLSHKRVNWIKDLEMEAETAVTKLQTGDQDYTM